MKHMLTRTVPSTTQEIVEFETCDLCGVKLKKLIDRGCLTKVTVSYETGTNYPEGGHGQQTSVDMCVVCFSTKLVPWLQSQGCEPRTKEWDW